MDDSRQELWKLIGGCMKGYDQRQYAKKLGVSEAALSKYLNGHKVNLISGAVFTALQMHEPDIVDDLRGIARRIYQFHQKQRPENAA